MLRGDHTMTESGTAVPAQLPPTTPCLVGREDEVAQIEGWLSATAARGTVPTVMITGAPGTGKTALATLAAQRLSSRYAAGQLAADLGGSADRPARAHSILEGFLLAIGVPAAQVPPDYAERSKLFRSWSAGRNLLVLLDDIASAAQVSALLPAFEGCAVITTSRLPHIPFGRLLPLPALSLGDGIELLARAVGKGRVAAASAAAESIVRACDRLPLAVNAAGARLAAEPSRPLWDLAGKLGDASRRLAELQAAGFDVQAACEANFRALSEQERAAVSALRVAPEGRFTSADAASWLGCGVEAADALLARLVAGHILTVTLDDGDGPASYAFFALAHAYARTRPGP
jgi:hypothetical protein